MYLEKQAHGVYTLHFDCNLILHHSGPRTHREADDGLSSSVSAISVSFMFCETLNKPLEEGDKTVLFWERIAMMHVQISWLQDEGGGVKKIKPWMKACAESFQFADITVKCVYKST